MARWCFGDDARFASRRVDYVAPCKRPATIILFFGAPIETSISPIRGEMPVLRRLTARHLNEFHDRLLKVDSPRHEDATGRISMRAFVWRGSSFVIILPDVRGYTSTVYGQLCHTWVPLLLFNLIPSMRASAHRSFRRRAVYQTFFSTRQLTCICVNADDHD